MKEEFDCMKAGEVAHYYMILLRWNKVRILTFKPIWKISFDSKKKVRNLSENIRIWGLTLRRKIYIKMLGF